MMGTKFKFRPLERADLPRLEAWLRAEHVSKSLGHAVDLEAKYFDGDLAVRRFMVLDGDDHIGMIHYYYWNDFPEAASAVEATVGEIGIDYLIADETLIGKGVGPEIFAAFLELVTHGRGDVAGVRVDIDEADMRSKRVLEALGFKRELDGIHLDGHACSRSGYVSAEPQEIFDSEQVDAVVQHVTAVEAPHRMRHRILAIDGLGGAGKSALAVLISRRLGVAPVIRTDDFASHDNPLNWYPRLLEQVLVPLSKGEPARYQRYDWDREQLAEWHELDPPDFIVLEGVTASRQAFRPYLTSTVWVETRRDERLRRGLERDGQQALALWEEWMREEDRYVAREHPEQTVDFVIAGHSRLATP